MSDLSKALADFTTLFDRMGIPYVVMGGMAVRVYGIPRATYDIDFTVGVPRDRLAKLYEAIRALGYTVPEQYETGWVDVVAGMSLVKARLYLTEIGIDVDLFLAESAFQEEVLKRRRLVQLETARVWFISPEDLILLKLLASRPRDRGDIADILFTQGQLDTEYMRRWAEQLGIRDALEEALTEPPVE
jgi:predicted nucleotidyltransferase